MSSEEREELAALYALGMLEGSELVAFERELAAHPELAALVAELEQASTLLATSVPQHPAPDFLRHSVLNQITDRRPAAEPARPRSPFSFLWLPWAIAAGLAVCCALLWNEKSRLTAAIGNLESENQSLLVRIAGLDAERVRLETRISALLNEKDQLQVRIASLEARDPLRDIQPVMLAAQRGAPAGAQIMALWDPQRQVGALRLAKLPNAAPDKDYQLWIITPESKQPMDAGVIPPSSQEMTFRAAQPIGQVAALAISLEPKGGSVVPRGPVIYLGKL
jgi:anti-sigma-K factor RskA